MLLRAANLLDHGDGGDGAEVDGQLVAHLHDVRTCAEYAIQHVIWSHSGDHTHRNTDLYQQALARLTGLFQGRPFANWTAEPGREVAHVAAALRIAAGTPSSATERTARRATLAGKQAA